MNALAITNPPDLIESYIRDYMFICMKDNHTLQDGSNGCDESRVDSATLCKL